MPLSLEKALEHVMEEHDDGSDSDGPPGLVDSSDSEAAARADESDSLAATFGSDSESDGEDKVDVEPDGEGNADDADGESAAVSTNSWQCPQGPKRRRLFKKTPVAASLCRRRSEVCAEAAGVTPKEYRCLRRLSAPMILFSLLNLMLRCAGTASRDIDGIEYFSGVSAIQRALSNAGFFACGYDIIHGPMEDLLTVGGFVAAVQWARRLKPQGLTHWACVCSTWVWISRDSTGRSAENPLGCDSLSNEEANAMVSRMMLIYFLITSRRGLFILEQPGSSMMPRHPRIKSARLDEVFTWMGCFGHVSKKPTVLLSNESLALARLSRKMTPEIEALCCSDGNFTKDEDGSVTGGASLKATQAYTDEYGEAVVEAWQRWKKHGTVEVEDSESDYGSQVDSDEWADAHLAEMVEALQRDAELEAQKALPVIW
jgi:hypothetical protein